MKILAIDHGTKRIGLAVSDELGITARALPVLKVKNEKQALQKILEIVKSEKCEKILMGIPSGYGDNTSPQAELVHDFTKKLQSLTSIETIFWDESYSSQQAEANLRNRTNKNIDSEAAKLFLLEYLHSTNT